MERVDLICSLHVKIHSFRNCRKNWETLSYTHMHVHFLLVLYANASAKGKKNAGNEAKRRKGTGMGQYLNVGNDGFQAIRKELYVDKTGLISFINGTLGTMRKLTCVSRPRRFGKSYAAKMLCAYYDKSCDSGKLFEGLKITKDSSYEKYLNRYDVIYLDITRFIFELHSDMKNMVPYIQKQVIQELVREYPLIERQDEDSLVTILFKVREATGNKFIFIIDEWDALFREAERDEAVQKEYIQLLRGLFKSPVTDKIIESVYMTGILPIKKYGTHSAMTDFVEYSMLDQGELEEYVGFTEQEVRGLCRKCDMDYMEMKRWYDGYSFSGIKSVYNPNSVVNAIRKRKIGSYWTKTETYESLRIYIDMDMDGLKESVAQLTGGVHCSIDTAAFQNDMTSIQSRDDVLTLLVHLGYLAYDEEAETVSIPNEEIRLEFIRAIKNSKRNELVSLIRESDLLLKHTLNMDGEKVAAAIEKIHSAQTAPLFYNNEQALRSVIRFAYISCIGEYKEIQELPSGTGYADVVYLPKKHSPMPILLIELKWNKTADGAISQIKEKKYPQVFEGYGSDILLVGINYDAESKKHECMIERYDMQK